MKILNLVNKIIKHTLWYQNYWCGVHKFWYLNTFNLDVINLGSTSGVWDFNYNNLPIKGMNWAIGPQSLMHDFNVLKNYFSYIKEGGSVIITLCPFSSLITQYSTHQNLKYYTFLHPATINEFNEKEREQALQIKQNPFKAMPLFCIKETTKEFLRALIPRQSKNKTNFSQNALYYIGIWKKQFNIQDLTAELQSQHKTEQMQRAQLLHKMVQFCEERDLHPVIVIPPIHRELSKQLPIEFRENYINSFIEKADIPKTLFYNFIDDERFQDDKYFHNAFLMNKIGAVYFIKELLKEIHIL